MTKITDLALTDGFTRAAVFPASILHPLKEVRDMCAGGRCRRYGTCWSCPPACGTIEEAEEEMKMYQKGILVQTTGRLSDDFDADGIRNTEVQHKKHFADLVRQARILDPECLPLSAGSCEVCSVCTYPDKPCRFPEKRFTSMEASGLLVSDVCKEAGLPYYYGPQTITFSSCILFHEGREIS